MQHAIKFDTYLLRDREVREDFRSKASFNTIIFQDLPSWTPSTWLKLHPSADNFEAVIKPPYFVDSESAYFTQHQKECIDRALWSILFWTKLNTDSCLFSPRNLIRVEWVLSYIHSRSSLEPQWAFSTCSIVWYMFLDIKAYKNVLR